jgi:hypothetical protein
VRTAQRRRDDDTVHVERLREDAAELAVAPGRRRIDAIAKEAGQALRGQRCAALLDQLAQSTLAAIGVDRPGV